LRFATEPEPPEQLFAISYQTLQKRCCGKNPFTTELAGAIYHLISAGRHARMFFTDADRAISESFAGVVRR
jgi:hypothetical protein